MTPTMVIANSYSHFSVADKRVIKLLDIYVYS